MSHVAPGAQSEDAVHRSRHVPAGPQRKLPHETGAPSLGIDESASSEHFATRGLQLPWVSQKNPSAQCTSFAQAVRQPASSQANGAHSWGAGRWHEPEPLHAPGPTYCDPEHVAVPHAVEAAFA